VSTSQIGIRFVTPPRLGLGKVPIPDPLTESGKLRTQPQDPLRSTNRGTSPSLHDSHDMKGRDVEMESVWERIRLLEERVAAQESRREASSPPGTVTLKSPSGWLAKAPPWLVLVGMIWGAAYAASRVPRDVWTALRRLLKLD
jgi:hypothetical protein